MHYLISDWIDVLIFVANCRDYPGSAEDDWWATYTSQRIEGVVIRAAKQRANEQGPTHRLSCAHRTSTLGCYIHAWYVINIAL